MARQAGYPRPGLKGMAESLFAIDLPKSKKARTYFWKRVPACARGLGLTGPLKRD